MATEILMPMMGYDMTEGRVVRWLKREGEAVASGEAVVEIETDKVAIEVESFGAGLLRRIEVGEGLTVPVGARIGIVAAADEALPPAQSTAATTPPPTLPAAVGRVVAGQPAAANPPATQGRAAGGGGAEGASPLARRLAQQHGVDLARVTGTGPGGKISREDVLVAAAAASQAAPAPTGDPLPVAPTRPLSRLQQTMGRRMAESKAQAPHFYLTMRADMTEALALRQRLNAAAVEGEARISVNDLIVKAAAGALRAFPLFNASFAGDHLVLHQDVAICVAVALDEGLVTPVLQAADQKPLAQIARESAALVGRTRAGKNRPEDYLGGTFTVSNLGMFEVETFVAIINPPQAAILAAGAVARTPVYMGDELVPRMLISLTLSTDHRVADGAAAARFLGAIRDALQHPEAL